MDPEDLEEYRESFCGPAVDYEYKDEKGEDDIAKQDWADYADYVWGHK